MESVRIHSKPLAGKVLAQPSKSVAHRAIICAALSKGVSRIDNIVLSDDISATLGAIRALGAEASVRESLRYPGRKSVVIRSHGEVKISQPVIDCLESGSTARFILPVTRLSDAPVTIKGHGRLVDRPFAVYSEVFENHGVTWSDHEGRMPITVSGRLVPGEYRLPGDVSSQFVSGLLFMLPLLEGPSEIIITNKLESRPYVEMTLHVLKEFGIQIGCSPDYLNFKVPGGQSYQAVSDYMIEGDWSQAAFFCVMGAIGGDIHLKGLNPDSFQGDKVILKLLEAMDARYHMDPEGIVMEHSALKGLDMDVSQCPDLVPALAVAACVAKGESRIQNAARLRIKESDRLSTTCFQLSQLGATITEQPDGLVIQGIPHFRGALTNGSGDHRIVMALAAASAACRGTIEIEGSGAVKKSYPEFWDDFKSIGGVVESL